MNAFERTAIEQYLSDYDNTLSYSEIMDRLDHDLYEDITVWQPFENEEGAIVASRIDDLFHTLEDTFNEKII